MVGSTFLPEVIRIILRNRSSTSFSLEAALSSHHPVSSPSLPTAPCSFPPLCNTINGHLLHGDALQGHDTMSRQVFWISAGTGSSSLGEKTKKPDPCVNVHAFDLAPTPRCSLLAIPLCCRFGGPRVSPPFAQTAPCPAPHPDVPGGLRPRWRCCTPARGRGSVSSGPSHSLSPAELIMSSANCIQSTIPLHSIVSFLRQLTSLDPNVPFYLTVFVQLLHWEGSDGAQSLTS